MYKFALVPVSQLELEQAVIDAVPNSRCNLRTIGRAAGCSVQRVQEMLSSSIAARLAWNAEVEACVEELELVIREHEGNLTEAAKALDLSRSWLAAAVRSSPYLQGVMQELRDSLVDLAEAELRSAIKAGNRWAVRMALLSQQAEQRHWRESSETVIHLVAGSAQRWQLTDLSDEALEVNDEKG